MLFNINDVNLRIIACQKYNIYCKNNEKQTNISTIYNCANYGLRKSLEYQFVNIFLTICIYKCFKTVFFPIAINSQRRTYHFMKQKMQRIKIIFENAKVLKQKIIHFSSNGRHNI